MAFNANVNNISVRLLEETGVPGEKQPTCRKSLTNFISYRLSWIRTHNVSGDSH